MNKFEKLFNYYTSIYKNENKYSNLGMFGESVWGYMINEGLITSYPKETVIKFLTSLGYEDVTNSKSETISILAKVKNVNQFKQTLNKKLLVYGYYISNVVVPYNAPNYTYKLIIEPKVPTELIPNKNDGNFYHITYKSLVDKIFKIGLTPKNSKTLFDHPGNRIYLIQTNDLKLLDQLKHSLSFSKKSKLEDDGYPKDVLGEVSPENMIVLKIDVDNLKLYNDPMFPSYMKTFQACFTTNNIQPNNIQKTNY